MDIITYALAKKFAKEYTDSEIEKLEGISYEIVDHLPDVGDESKIYLVPAGAGNDSYEEYIYINGTFERLGYLDLSEYVKKIMIAKIYSSEATYAVGDVAINEDILYECKVAIDVPEEFNGEHWDEISVQDEIDKLKNTKQDNLVNQVNIKSVNNNSLLGSGNLSIVAKHTFESSWNTTGTTVDFCTSIVSDASAVPGMIYMGKLRCNDLPGGLIQGEATVEIISEDSNGKAIRITLTSVDTSPYRWEYERAKVNGHYVTSGWKGYQIEINESNKLSSDLVNDIGNINKFVTASEKTTWNEKQEALVSGTNIKTINNTSILGSGNIDTTYGVATSSTAGLVKSSTTGTTANRDYNVEVNNDGTMKVNVPWVDTSIIDADLEEFDVNYGVLKEKYTVIGSNRTWNDVTTPLSPSVPLYNIVKNAIPLLPPENIIKIEELLDASFDDLGATGKCLIDETLNNGTTAQCLGTQRTDLNSGSIVWSNNNIYYIAVIDNSVFEFYRLTYDYSNYGVEANTGIYKFYLEVDDGSLGHGFYIYLDYAAFFKALEVLAAQLQIPAPVKIDLDELKTLFDSLSTAEKLSAYSYLASCSLARNYIQQPEISLIGDVQYPAYKWELDTNSGDFKIIKKQGDTATTLFNLSDVASIDYDISLIANVGGSGSGGGAVTPTDIELNIQRWTFKINNDPDTDDIIIFTCYTEEELEASISNTNDAIDKINTTYSLNLQHISDFNELNTTIATALSVNPALANALYSEFIFRCIAFGAERAMDRLIQMSFGHYFTLSSISSVVPTIEDDNIIGLDIIYSIYSAQLQETKLAKTGIDISSLSTTSTFTTFTKLKGEGVASGSSSGSDKKYNVIKMNVPQANSRHVYFLPSNSNMNYIYQVLSSVVGVTVNANNFNSVMASIFTGASSINDLHALLKHLPNACEKIYLETTLPTINNIYMKQACSSFIKNDNKLSFVTLPIGEWGSDGTIIEPTAGTTSGELADWQTVTITLEDYKANDGDDIYDQENA